MPRLSDRDSVSLLRKAAQREAQRHDLLKRLALSALQVVHQQVQQLVQGAVGYWKEKWLRFDLQQAIDASHTSVAATQAEAAAEEAEAEAAAKARAAADAKRMDPQHTGKLNRDAFRAAGGSDADFDRYDAVSIDLQLGKGITQYIARIPFEQHVAASIDMDNWIHDISSFATTIETLTVKQSVDDQARIDNLSTKQCVDEIEREMRHPTILVGTSSPVTNLELAGSRQAARQVNSGTLEAAMQAVREKEAAMAAEYDATIRGIRKAEALRQQEHDALLEEEALRKKEHELAMDAVAKAHERARWAEEQARKAAEEQLRMAAQEQARVTEQSRKAAQEQLRITAQEQARMAAEEQSRITEQSRKAAQEELRMAAQEQSHRAAEEQSRRTADKKERLPSTAEWIRESLQQEQETRLDVAARQTPPRAVVTSMRGQMARTEARNSNLHVAMSELPPSGRARLRTPTVGTPRQTSPAVDNIRGSYAPRAYRPTLRTAYW